MLYRVSALIAARKERKKNPFIKQTELINKGLQNKQKFKHFEICVSLPVLIFFYIESLLRHIVFIGRENYGNCIGKCCLAAVEKEREPIYLDNAERKVEMKISRKIKRIRRNSLAA